VDHDRVDALVLEQPVDVAGLHVVLVGEVTQPGIVVRGCNHFHPFNFAQGANPGRGVRVCDSQKSYDNRFQRIVSFD
jgi:hypothetical protein